VDRKRARLIDVREPFELNICTIEGATHIPMRQIPQHLEQLPTDLPLLVFCHHGGRSGQVAHFLRARGFEQVSNISGGIDAWAREITPGMQRY
jgi:adenylyltransferase/sulfurtransferase